MTKTTSAASAASFLSTAKAPKSRKPSAKAVQPPATPSVAAQLVAAQPQIAAQAAEKPTKRTAPDLKLVLTAKGAKFSPSATRGKVRGDKNVATWATIKAMFSDNAAHTASEILSAIPSHRDFMGYALRSGWLQAA